MVFRINYNYVAAFLGLCLVAVFCCIELAAPRTLGAESAALDGGAVALPVAMYHHVLTEPSRLGDYVISPEQFEEDLQYIQKCGYTTISAAELLDFTQNGTPLPEKPIMITFDDGYESVHEYAFPLLQKYGMKAVISVIGRYTDLFSDPNETRHINYSHCTWDQLREMQQSGVFEIGNHTYDSHVTGTNGKRFGIRIKKGESPDAYREYLYEDVGAFSQKIADEIGVSPSVFAYPFGALCNESKPLLTEMGFRVILTCEEKVNTFSPGMEEPVVVKRFNRAHRYSTYEYYCKKLGLQPAA